MEEKWKRRKKNKGEREIRGEMEKLEKTSTFPLIFPISP